MKKLLHLIMRLFLRFYYISLYSYTVCGMHTTLLLFNKISHNESITLFHQLVMLTLSQQLLCNCFNTRWCMRWCVLGIFLIYCSYQSEFSIRNEIPLKFIFWLCVVEKNQISYNTIKEQGNYTLLSKKYLRLIIRRVYVNI